MLRTWFTQGVSLVGAVAASFAVAAPATAQAGGTLSVTVRDRTNDEGINGARIVIEGTQFTGVADGRGQLVLSDIPAGSYSVRVLAIGYRSSTQQVTLTNGQTTEMSVQLGLSAVSLNEIVVTGTGGAVEKRKLGATLGTVDVDRVKDLVPAQDLGSILQARIPGVRSIGMAGGIGSTRDLRVRGVSSASLGQRPVIYIDGVRIDNGGGNWGTAGTACCAFDGGAGMDRLSDLNPEDIDRVEVIKGAAAATLYGTEATNGVIQIFTKRGRRNSAPRWTLSYNAGFNRLRENLPTKLYPNFTGPDGTQARDANTLIENGLIQEGQVTVQGGGESVQYFLSGGLLYEQGSIQPNDMRRGNVRLNMNWDSGDKWSFELNSAYSNNQAQLLQSGNNWTALLGNALLGNPKVATADRPFGEPWVSIEDIRKMQSESHTNRWTGGATVNFNPTDAFGHRLTVGMDAVNDRRDRFFPFGGQYIYVGTDGERSLGFREFSSYTVDYLGTLGFSLTDGIQSDFSFGAQGFWETTRQNTAIGEGFAASGVTTVDGAAARNADEFFSESINIGLFAQNRFSIADKLFVTAGARLDGNSAFGQNFGLQFYPKGEIAYVISEEGFFPEQISSLRLRGAVGMSGLAPGAFDQFRTFQPFAVLGGQNGVRPQNPGNADLEPEKTTEVEGGFDLGLFDGRLSLELTGYYSRTRDAILPVPLPPSQGFLQSRRDNVGEIENRGWEAKIDAAIVEGANTRWSVGLNMDGNRNKILELGPGAECNADRSHCKIANDLRTGRAVRALFARTVDSYDPVANEHTASDTSEFIGDPLPHWNGSLYNTVEVGPLRFYGLVTWEKGAWFSNGDRPYQYRQQAGDEYLSTLAADGSATFATDSLLDYFTLFGSVDKRDNIRLGEVSVTYQLPESFMSSLGLGRSSIAVSGQNLMWWDDCNCRDPNGAWRAGDEVFTGDGLLVFGNSDFLSTPQPRRFVFSFRTTF